MPKGDRKQRGRPSLLTADVQAEICKALEIAVPLKYAAEAAGVAEMTVLHWMERGKAAKPGDDAHVAFLEAVTRARAKAVPNLHAKALVGGKGSAAAQWFLERRFRQEYGPTQKLEHSGPDGAPIQIERPLSELSDEELQKIADARRQS